MSPVKNRASEEKEAFVVVCDTFGSNVARQSKWLNTFTKTQAQAPEVPIVVLTSMDNETFAINAVRKGPRIILSRERWIGNLLVLTIRYAIARKQGEYKRFSILDLKEFDGKEGRLAYIAFNGKVYNVSNSRLWKEGIHTGSHFAGNDLTESILKAPHGEEIHYLY